MSSCRATNGNPLAWDMNESTFIGTVQMPNGLVWHVWDQASPSGGDADG